MSAAFHYLISLAGYFLIGCFFPVLYLQGMWLRKKVMRLLPPKDPPEGVCPGQKQGLKIIGLGESTMAGVGIPKHSETLTGLTASRLNAMTDRSIDWKILAENGLTIEQLNELIKKQDLLDAEIIMVAIGGNDVFKLTSPWKWEKQLKNCLFL
ncbi:MAG: SGNH/GDSL hydrolase family protein, partial [SAR324 cluster bacterium]|nr:SGNH/GDSL hydrolase family protein [SAR324 cluster bacterium]